MHHAGVRVEFEVWYGSLAAAVPHGLLLRHVHACTPRQRLQAADDLLVSLVDALFSAAAARVEVGWLSHPLVAAAAPVWHTLVHHGDVETMAEREAVEMVGDVGEGRGGVGGEQQLGGRGSDGSRRRGRARCA